MLIILFIGLFCGTCLSSLEDFSYVDDGTSEVDESIVFKCYGVNSDDESVCSGGGDCIDYNTCECGEGIDGDNCQYVMEDYEGATLVCFGVPNTDPTICSGHGVCLGFDDCECIMDYQGMLCNINAEGFVEFDFECYGLDPLDLSVCSGNGYCNYDGECMCYSGWGGDECDTVTCYGFELMETGVCSGRGLCAGNDFCICAPGFSGEMCEEVDQNDLPAIEIPEVEGPPLYSVTIYFEQSECEIAPLFASMTVANGDQCYCYENEVGVAVCTEFVCTNGSDYEIHYQGSYCDAPFTTAEIHEVGVCENLGFIATVDTCEENEADILTGIWPDSERLIVTQSYHDETCDTADMYYVVTYPPEHCIVSSRGSQDFTLYLEEEDFEEPYMTRNLYDNNDCSGDPVNATVLPLGVCFYDSNMDKFFVMGLYEDGEFRLVRDMIPPSEDKKRKRVETDDDEEEADDDDDDKRGWYWFKSNGREGEIVEKRIDYVMNRRRREREMSLGFEKKKSILETMKRRKRKERRRKSRKIDQDDDTLLRKREEEDDEILNIGLEVGALQGLYTEVVDVDLYLKELEDDIFATGGELDESVMQAFDRKKDLYEEATEKETVFANYLTENNFDLVSEDSSFLIEDFSEDGLAIRNDFYGSLAQLSDAVLTYEVRYFDMVEAVEILNSELETIHGIRALLGESLNYEPDLVQLSLVEYDDEFSVYSPVYPVLPMDNYLSTKTTIVGLGSGEVSWEDNDWVGRAERKVKMKHRKKRRRISRRRREENHQRRRSLNRF